MVDVSLRDHHDLPQVLTRETTIRREVKRCSVSVNFDERERDLLSCGLLEWSGPASPTDAIAAALGFNDVAHLLVEAERIGALLDNGAPLTRLDAARALAATEIVFASNVFGSGLDWTITTGLADEATIQALRALQRKLGGEYSVTEDGGIAEPLAIRRVRQRSAMHPDLDGGTRRFAVV